MSYTDQPVPLLLKGPLLHTPQGWVVLASIGVYLALAGLLWFEVVAPPAGKNIEASVVACLLWPLITFLFFVKTNLPDFSASWSKTFFVAMSAFAPIVYACVMANPSVESGRPQTALVGYLRGFTATAPPHVKR